MAIFFAVSTMKLLIVCFLLGLLQAYSATALLDNGLNPEELECVYELQLDASEIIEENKKELAPEDDTNFKNFLTCYWTKLKWMEINGTINVEKLKKAVTDAALADVDSEDISTKILIDLMVQSAFKKCYATAFSPIDPSATAVKAQNCVVKALNDIIDK